MIIYLDILFIINFLFDLLLLSSINTILKRNIPLKRLILGSMYGSLSIILINSNFPKIIFFLIKIIMGLEMIIITFSYKSFNYTLKNFYYLLIISFCLGGFIYYIRLSYNNISIFLILIISIIFMIFYSNKERFNNKDISKYYKVDIYLDDKIIRLNAYLDTANKLYDPYFHKPVIIANNNIRLKSKNVFYIPYNTINSSGIMKTYLIKKIFISSVGFKYNVLIAQPNDKFNLDGVDIILHSDMEG